MIRHRKSDASLLPISSPEAGALLQGAGDSGKPGSVRKTSIGGRRRKIRSKRQGLLSGWSLCCFFLCILPMLLIAALIFYVKMQPPHHQHQGNPSKIMALYSKMEPYLSSSSTTTIGHLLEHDPQLEQIFQAAKPVDITVNNQKESVFLVFLTIRDATVSTTTAPSRSALHSPYKVFQGHSTSSAREALHNALSQIGMLPILAKSKWIHLDFVDSVMTLNFWNYQEPIPHEPDWWYGLAMPHLGDNSSFAFTPTELFTNALVDSRGFLRWDHVWNLVEKKGRQTRGLTHRFVSLEHVGVTTDDATILPQVDLFTSQAYFGEVVTSPSHSLAVSWTPVFHGHRAFPANHDLLLYVQQAMSNALQFWLTNIVQEDGSMIYAYHPRSNLVKLPHDDQLLDYHYLTRHMSTMFAMSRWLLCQPKEPQPEEQAIIALVHEAVVKGLDFVLSKALRKDCPLPFKTDVMARCMAESTDVEHTKYTTTRLDLNALTILALIEYVSVLTSTTSSVHGQSEQQIEQYWMAAVDLAHWISGAQREDGSLIQKVVLKPSLELDQEYYVHYYPGLATFAMARLCTVANRLRQASEPQANDRQHQRAAAAKQDSNQIFRKLLAMLPNDDDQQTWFEVAAKTAQFVVTDVQQKNQEDADFLFNHWLMHGLAELQVTMKHKNLDLPGSFKEYVHHAIQVLRKYQTTTATLEEDHSRNGKRDNDRAGIFYDDLSASATALKVNGLCSVYEWMDVEYRTYILEMVEASVRYQLQAQYGPELAMFLQHPHLVLGGFRESIMGTELRVDFIQHNLQSLVCLERLLKAQPKAVA